NIQIFRDLVGFVGFEYVARARVGGRVHGHRADAEPAQGTDDPDRDLAPVGHQHPAEQGSSHEHIRTPPKPTGSSGALAAAESARPSTVRVSTGSITPSSHSLAVE